MAKKLKQGQKYPEGFTQMQILLKLCEKDRTPTSEILDFLKERFYIREQKNIREHHLKNLEKQKLIKRESAGRGHPDHWSVIPDFKVLKEIIKRIKDHPRAQHDFMESKNYRSWIPELGDALNCSFAEIGLTTIDVTRASEDVERIKNDAARLKKQRYAEDDSYDPNPPYTFSDSELKDITKALECNWTMLRFIVYYLSTDNESKRELMLKLVADSRLATTSGAIVAATANMRWHIINFIRINNLRISGVDGYPQFFDAGDLYHLYVPPSHHQLADRGDYHIAESMHSYAMKTTIKQLTGRDIEDLPIMWFSEWFAGLDVMRDRYPFLFD